MGDANKGVNRNRLSEYDKVPGVFGGGAVTPGV